MECRLSIIGVLFFAYLLYLFYKFKENEVKKQVYVFGNKFVDLINHSKSPEEAIKIISEEENSIFSRKLKKILFDSKTSGLFLAMRKNAKKTHITEFKDMINTIAFSIDSGARNTGKIITKKLEHYELKSNLKKQRLKNMFFVSFFILIYGTVLFPLTIVMLFYFFGQTYEIDLMTSYFINFVAITSAFLFGILREDKRAILFLIPLCVCISSYVVSII